MNNLLKDKNGLAEGIQDILARYNSRRTEIDELLNDKSKSNIVKPRKAENRLKSKVFSHVSRALSKNYVPSHWDLTKVRGLLGQDSLFKRAVEKYVELMFRQGYDFIGDNKNNISYVKSRLEQIAEVSDLPTQILFDSIAFNLVTYQNSIVVKQRDYEASGGKRRTTFYGKPLDPVAGYFPVDSSYMTVKTDRYGNPTRYKQMKEPIGSQPENWAAVWRQTQNLYMSRREPTWATEDIIHMRDRSSTPSDILFSMPMVYPVIADIEALRELEELMLLQSAKIATSREHVTIGDKDGKQDNIAQRVQNYRDYFASVPIDGTIVTEWDVEIGNVNKDDPAMSLVKYTDHFKWRVQAGLGISDVSYGQGDTSNKNTASEMTTETQNTAAKFCRIFESYFNQYIVKELLLERGYSPTALNRDNMVYLKIHEIDLERKIKTDSHYADLFLKNLITQDEARQSMGWDPFQPGDIQNTYQKLYEVDPAVTNKSDNTVNPTNQHGRQKGSPSKQKRKD